MPYPLRALTALLDIEPPAGPAPSQEAVTGVTHDSRRVRPGDLYAALPGAQTHGARFGSAAADAGAVAILTDPVGRDLLAADGVHQVPVVVVADPRSELGAVAAAVYGHPARDLLMLGVTGTNGKTTTAYLLEAGLRAAGHTTGLIGTIETRVGDAHLPSVRTTPEATDVQALLAVMRERGVTACAMEVSSHALVLGRVDGIVFDVAGFTNLTQDHLDFHGDLEGYFAAKAALFTPGRSRRAVVCVDGDHGRRLAAEPRIPTTTLATTLATDDRFRGRADWRVTGGAAMTLERSDGTRTAFRTALPGAFNVANAALAVAMLAEAGVDLETAVAGVGGCRSVPGRMQTVTSDDPRQPLAVVDYAHTPDAIENVLAALGTSGRLIAVVGAGGDRDRDKRPLMGAAAASCADVVVVTDDNPRSEDPAAIRAAVISGAEAATGTRPVEIVDVGDRREAIRSALAAAAGPDDVVVVLGKGHEQGQEIAGVVHPFDDRQVLLEELRRWSREQVTR